MAAAAVAAAGIFNPAEAIPGLVPGAQGNAGRRHRSRADDGGDQRRERRSAPATPTSASAATGTFVFTREQQIVQTADTDSIGAGVRALVDGTWGFAATKILTKDGVAAAAREAVAIAKANRIARDQPVVARAGAGISQRDVEERLHDRSVHDSDRAEAPTCCSRRTRRR